MDSNFLFSIIIPVYNTGKYIDKCLNSVMKAINTDCEVIIVNDGSTDDSEEHIKAFMEGIPENYKNNFVYIKKENKGLADTKNVGIEASRGKFISVVDSDDWISDDFYTVARKYVEDYEMIVYDLYIVFEKDKSQNYTSRAFRDYIDDPKSSFLNGAMSGSSCNKIIKKELYKDYKFPVGKQYEDTAVTPFIICDAEKIKYVPYPMYYYLQREKSIVASNTYATAFYKICSNITDTLEGKNIDDYKWVINEFIIDRILDNLDLDLTESKQNFIGNLNNFHAKNQRILEYAVSNDMTYKFQNHYSERQKQMVKQLLIDLKEGNSKKVQSALEKRRILNKFRKIIRR